MTGKGRIEQYLNENNVPYQSQHHPLAITGQEVADVEHIPGRLMTKTVMVIADGRLVLLAVPATHEVDLDLAGVALHAREVRLAREDEFDDRFPDCETGAMPPFGNLYGLPVFVDRSLAEDETIVFRAGSHEETISLAYRDFAGLVRPVVARLARRLTF